MQQFHDHFRHEFAAIQRDVAALERQGQGKAGKRAGGAGVDRTVRDLLSHAMELCRYLDLHHRIEEAHIFPVLARRIPDFARGAAHTREHQQMHAALDGIEKYSKDVLAAAHRGGAPAEDAVVFDIDVFKEHLARIEKTLLPHLEAEEKSLEAENLIKHGVTIQDVMQIMV